MQTDSDTHIETNSPGNQSPEKKSMGERLSDYWIEFENSAMPVALKWSLSISILVIIAMSLLGTYLITQHELSYKQQADSMGGIIVQQLAHASSEPLMADDVSAITLMLEQQLKNPAVSGLDIHDSRNQLVVAAGHNPARFSDSEAIMSWSCQLPDTDNGSRAANCTVYTSPIHYKDVLAGYARISLDNTPLEKSLQNLRGLLIAVTAVFILFTVLLVFPLARRLTKPLYQLAASSEQNENIQSDHNHLENRRDEIGKLASSFRQLSHEKKQKDQLEQTIHRYLSPRVAQHLIRQQNYQLGGHLVTGSVLFCDIVGYTQISESLTPTETANMLNSYYRLFSQAAEACHGTIDKFIGDAMMVLFSIPEQDDEHGLHAITCALLMQAITQAVNRAREKQSLQTLQFRIGICSGEMMAGNLGGEDRMEYTVIGDTVNLASRLCSLAAPGGITVHALTQEQPGVNEKIRGHSMGDITIRGRREPAHVYQITGISHAYSETVQEILNNLLSNS